MAIMPFGCRAYAVKPRVAVSKTRIEPRALAGVHLCRTAGMPGAYSIWIPTSRSVVTTSDVYFDETLFPWRPSVHSDASPSRRDAPPVANPGTDDGSQPPGLPSAVAPAPVRAAPKRILILFSGPLQRTGGLAELIRAKGFSVDCIDSDATHGGGPSHNVLDDSVFQRLLAACAAG
eukprot:1019912-Pleurochrysis_carterae.AAC.1